MQATWSIFPKFQQQLDPHGLAALVRDVGLDTTNLVVREKYWVEPKNLATDTTKFVEAMKREGVEIQYATTDYTPAQLIKAPIGAWRRLIELAGYVMSSAWCAVPGCSTR